ncbi:PEP-CTERM sorting domain-containing protein [Ruficoccus amylovorans]|uniref:PEP-CTERM sorting domain-containing protein n=1 Tax=Ruficoccus amylovorans TaxID=1804625 RepID=A0A842HB43_9BACT|nr:PEP-CTERM sorting domain-containing protein [Ruficoccus amylovorans]MBC2593693.1 PEP-CTERM sorting domain-containing protein [Ruficoccus amylovorans]
MRLKTLIMGALLGVIGAQTSQADVTISNVTFTDTALSFTLSGTLTGPAPASLGRSLMIVASDPTDNDWILSPSTTLTPTSSDLAVAGTPIDLYMTDSFASTSSIYFQTNGGYFTTGDTVSGTYTATFASGIFDLSNLDSDLILVWGADNFNQGGIQAGAVQGFFYSVPEPSTYASVLALGVLGFITARRMVRVHSR